MDPLTLVGPRVELRTMTASDGPALLAAAADGQLWNLKTTVIPSSATIDAYLARAMQGLADGSVLPFVVSIRSTQQVVGTTRFFEIDRENRKLEIGSTWLAATWQRTFVNTECKYILLKHAFEVMSCIRVQFTTDELNTASRAAILRLGAKDEGLIRHDRIMPDGRVRTSVRYSIIASEWPGVKAALEGKLSASERPRPIRN
jgi:RimJ/RimL family protein N-acetyltransferase